MKISVFGMGYVGAVTSACLAHLGHSVVGIDIVEKKVELIRKGNSPIVEAGLDQLFQESVKMRRLTATTDASEALKDTNAIIVCVGTPSYPNGEVNLTFVLKVAKEIASHLKGQKHNPVVIFRSTMPPGTMENVIRPLFTEKMDQDNNLALRLVYHPEFLREGSATSDFFESPQIVVASVNGMNNKNIEEFFLQLYKGINFSFHIVQTRTAEMIKYVNNTFHALKISFANEIGRISRNCGINTHELFEVFFADTKLNISPVYLRPGFAFGGSCLPKDLKALSAIAKRLDIDVPVVSHIERSNDVHIESSFQLILNSGCRKIGFLGLSFKIGTEDIRESPFVRLVEKCVGKGMDIRIFDKSINIGTLMGKNLDYLNEHINHITERFVGTVDEVINLAELIVLCHADKLYLDAIAERNPKRVLDLTGDFKRSDLSESMISIIVSKDNTVL